MPKYEGELPSKITISVVGPGADPAESRIIIMTPEKVRAWLEDDGSLGNVLTNLAKGAQNG